MPRTNGALMLMALVEEAVRSSIPVVIIDIKGDLPNLLLTFPP